MKAFLSDGALPAKAKADAAHLAVATSHRVDYLLTWNLKHLADDFFAASPGGGAARAYVARRLHAAAIDGRN